MRFSWSVPSVDIDSGKGYPDSIPVLQTQSGPATDTKRASRYHLESDNLEPGCSDCHVVVFSGRRIHLNHHRRNEDAQGILRAVDHSGGTPRPIVRLRSLSLIARLASRSLVAMHLLYRQETAGTSTLDRARHCCLGHVLDIDQDQLTGGSAYVSTVHRIERSLSSQAS